jgi:hypothetical protein
LGDAKQPRHTTQATSDPHAVIQRIKAAQMLPAQARRSERGCAYVVVEWGDGSTITMADTPESQAEYSQMASQAPGCGFPTARIVVLFSLAVGTVLEAAIGS